MLYIYIQRARLYRCENISITYLLENVLMCMHHASHSSMHKLVHLKKACLLLRRPLENLINLYAKCRNPQTLGIA